MRSIKTMAFWGTIILCGNIIAASQPLEKLVGTAKSGIIEVPAGSYFVDKLSIPANVTLKISNGAVINVKYNLELNCILEAGGGCRIFEGDGTVNGNIKAERIYPQWFGAIGDGKNDDTCAIQKAADLAKYSSGGLLFIPSGKYLFTKRLNISCDVECKGVLIKEIEVDESKTEFSYATFCKWHHLKSVFGVNFVPDSEPSSLSPDVFYGIKENDFKIPNFKSIPLLDGSGTIDMQEGGTLTFYSSDFFSSRLNNYGDEFYDKNDCTQLVSPAGDVFPEFCFSYGKTPEAEAWSADKSYKKGDYCKYLNKTYKAAYPSGKNSKFTNTYKGTVDIGAVQPDEKNPITYYKFKYKDGSNDKLMIWRQVQLKVLYRAPQRHLTVNGLAVEIFLKNDNGKTMRIGNDSTVSVMRSDMTFNNMRISCMSRNATLSVICNVSSCANLTFNNCYFSGATNHGLGYNILHSNCANVTYNNCISTNCRDAMAGRHGKNITVNGGFYNRIDDHYGKNYVIRNVEMNALSTFIPGYRTPTADLEKWGFQPEGAFAFSGGNIFIENCRIYNCSSVFSGRGDIGDLFGTVSLKNIIVETDRNVLLFAHTISNTFDYAHEVRTPSRVIIENVYINKPYKLELKVDGFKDSSYGKFFINNCDVSGKVNGCENLTAK